MVDVIVPTVTGREADLGRCMESIARHTRDYQTIVIRDEETCGQAWIEGLKVSKAPWVLLCCDDIELTGDEWLSVCIEAVSQGKLPCPVVYRPNGSLESCGGDMNASACLISHLLDDWTEVDFTVLPFMSREQAEQIGMHSGHYLTDTYVSYKGRELGYPTVIRRGFTAIHHHSNVKRREVSPDDRRLFEEALREPV